MMIEIKRTPINWPTRCVNCWREAVVTLPLASSYFLVPPVEGVPFCANCAGAPQLVRRCVILSIAIMFSGLLVAGIAVIALAPQRDKHVMAILAIDGAAVLWCAMVSLLTWLVLRNEARAAGRVSVFTPVKLVRNDSSAPRIVLNVKRREIIDYLLEHNEARIVASLIL